MIKYLIKSTNELRLETKDEVDEFHKIIAKQAEDHDYTLSAWSETKKEKKSKGEILEEWYIVKYTFVFNDPKDPERALKNLTYELVDSYNHEEEDEYDCSR